MLTQKPNAMRILTYLIPLVLFITACGGEQSKQQESETSAQPDAETSTASVEADRTIDIIGTDQMKFVVEEKGDRLGTAETIKGADGSTYLLLQDIKAKPGQQIRIRLTTVSQLPASAMSHNWVLLEMGIDPAAFAQAAQTASDNAYIPESQEDDIIAYTDLAGGGETVEVTFTVPDETGDYDYLCSFPGHFAAGMRGELIVQS